MRKNVPAHLHVAWPGSVSRGKIQEKPKFILIKIHGRRVHLCEQSFAAVIRVNARVTWRYNLDCGIDYLKLLREKATEANNLAITQSHNANRLA